MITKTVSIIIPCISIDIIIKKTVKILSSINRNNFIYNIIIITDNYSKENLHFPNNVEIIEGKQLNMSEKRNLAAFSSKDEFIAFIDSDAYPDKNWLINGVEELIKNKDIGIVTGPDLIPPEQTGWEKIIGECHKSFLISGSKTFRKKISNRKFCDQASSCNMIMRTVDYKNIKGMNEKIYIGEDIDLCNKIKRKNLSILYNPKVKIFHYVRKFKFFLIQRFIYGTCVFEVIPKTHFFSYLQFLLPLIFLFYLITTLSLSILYNLNLLFFVIPLFLFLFLIVVEALKIASNKKSLYKYMAVFFFSFLSISLGSFVALIGLKINRKKIYTKR